MRKSRGKLRFGTKIGVSGLNEEEEGEAKKEVGENRKR